jgi:hypothetical protein
MARYPLLGTQIGQSEHAADFGNDAVQHAVSSLSVDAIVCSQGQQHVALSTLQQNVAGRVNRQQMIPIGTGAVLQ